MSRPVITRSDRTSCQRIQLSTGINAKAVPTELPSTPVLHHAIPARAWPALSSTVVEPAANQLSQQVHQR